MRAWGVARRVKYGTFPFIPETNFLRVVSDFVAAFPAMRSEIGLVQEPERTDRPDEDIKLRVAYIRVKVEIPKNINPNPQL